MKFLKSRRGAAVITALVVAFSIVFGAGRSLNAVRNDIWTVYDQGVNGDGHSVRGDLEARRNTCINLYKVATNYLPETDLDGLASLLERTARENESISRTTASYEDLDVIAGLVIRKLQEQPLSGKDAQYVSGFQTELQSRTFSIAHDPYTEMAETFNTRTLTAFPANLLHRVAGVKSLPVYH